MPDDAGARGNGRRLVLWDVDLTLVDYRGIGGDWYRRALAAVTGHEMGRVPTFPGRTERSITREILAAHGFAGSDELIERMYAELVAIAERERAHLPEKGHALPGAAEILAALDELPHVVQTLVTGNLAEVAHYKLAAFGLDEFVDLDIGGYGSVSEHRADLVADAVRRAGDKHGVDFPPDAVVVLGDTPNDVAAALAHGAVAVGVATGRSDEAELRESGAQVVLPDLTEIDAVLAAVLTDPVGA
ncbi:HAD family hydrolase [Gandjariella thermophila]|uniref:Haloacid dehalogenase n=1 Tax=Gandjariella thermophila TaxID=1931992 RepID=A0A4D4J640_9PSEU|nr:haloacid dehalogenase-like hydrolase [Gandjariella thermophila]GDY30540.1 haloacid dehalogenase [Gandjariella thermophila]